MLVLGNGGVGKTSLIRRFCRRGPKRILQTRKWVQSGAEHGADAPGARSNQFTDTYTKTIGVDFLEMALQVDALGRTVRLQLWDTAGQEEFDALTRSYYRGAPVRCTSARKLQTCYTVTCVPLIEQQARQAHFCLARTPYDLEIAESSCSGAGGAGDLHMHR